MSTLDRREFTRRGAGSLLGLALGRVAPLPPAADDLAERMAHWMEVANTPGAAIALVRDGAVAWSRGFGVRAAGAPETVDAETVFQAASLSKPLLAYAVLRLREEGRIDLDRPLAAYLGASPAPNDPRAADVTPRHVLSHSTGFANWRFRPDQTLSTAFAPGERFGYSGEGFVFLQRVVERITGTGYAAYMRERVLAPLGMARSSFLWESALGDNLAAGHSNRGAPQEPRSMRQAQQLQEMATRAGKPLDSWTYEESERALAQLTPPVPTLPVYVQPNAAGGLLTTAGDYGRFIARVAAGTLPGLSPASHRMFGEERTHINSALGWGHGWGVERVGARALLWHWGDNPGFKNFVVVDPQRRSGVVIFSNGDNGLRVCDRALALLTGDVHDAFLWL